MYVSDLGNILAYYLDKTTLLYKYMADWFIYINVSTKTETQYPGLRDILPDRRGG
jgi:hypothetical protein